jgi:predicted amidohydrolase
MNNLNIALVQMRCEKGAIDENLAAMHESLASAAARGVDVIAFPEASITGYIDPLRYPDAVLRVDGPEVARFVATTSGTQITAIAGLIEANGPGRPWITQVVARGGRLLGFYRKRTIPDDEAALFSPGDGGVGVFAHPKARFGVAICADIDNAAVFAECAGQGAQVVFEVAAPGLYGEQAARDWQAGYDWWREECRTKLGRYACENGIYVAVATQAGRTRDEDFPGGGYVFAPDGACLSATPDWSQGVLYATLALAPCLAG